MRVISEYFFRRVSLLVLITLLSSCGGGGDDNAPNYIGGSNLTSSSTTISRTYDTNGSRRVGGVSIGWKSFNVSKIVVGMPPGQTQPPWLDVSVTVASNQ